MGRESGTLIGEHEVGTSLIRWTSLPFIVLCLLFMKSPSALTLAQMCLVFIYAPSLFTFTSTCVHRSPGVPTGSFVYLFSYDALSGTGILESFTLKPRQTRLV